ncbi:hypothetical protein IHN32_12590 [Deinococcus sp. 14RED07]|uniref:hypothetical protein n=1 Tax=Deinococcus sp. 14RED07 TaxID=2745874 RepID=UPI001E458958|nr:hypothetical protein [Deinococcus sp. 14RED07]MCD0176781.1 hypothetical protein [Deinococcus sp. 14RED07]
MVTFYPTQPEARADAAARGLREESGLTLTDPDYLTSYPWEARSLLCHPGRR